MRTTEDEVLQLLEVVDALGKVENVIAPANDETARAAQGEGGRARVKNGRKAVAAAV